MLLGNNTTKNNQTPYNEFLCCFLYSQGKYAESYNLLNNSKDSVSKYYNMALCCYWAEDYEQTILYLEQSITKLSNLNRPKLVGLDSIEAKIKDKQKKTDDFITFLLEEYMYTFPNETFDNCLRFKVECLKHLKQWSSLLKVTSLIENKKYRNVELAIQEANKNINEK